MIELTVPAGADGERLDVFLAEPLGSRSRAQRLIDAGAVSVDGAPATKARRRLAVGQRVEVDVDAYAPAEHDASERQNPDQPFTIVHQDEHLLVVDKPAGLVVHPGRGHMQGTLVQALAGLAGGGEDPQRPGIVHRLDRETSGLLVVARHEEALRRLRAALSERRITREYLALVHGRPPSRTGTVEAPIGRDRRQRTKMSIDTDEPRQARTHFVIERALPTTTLLRLTLDTGRTHQIRV
ncbi:MAG TPA: RluA family pseudouridine synthase, partial [Solirubrobacteraceae bacterium]|nr:RluA family pseudouridine synthase [Solirubrobacteraceae bacterium]